MTSAEALRLALREANARADHTSVLYRLSCERAEHAEARLADFVTQLTRVGEAMRDDPLACHARTIRRLVKEYRA